MLRLLKVTCGLLTMTIVAPLSPVVAQGGGSRVPAVRRAIIANRRNTGTYCNYPDSLIVYTTTPGNPPSGPGARGFCLVGAGQDLTGSRVLGITLHVNPARFVLAIPVSANGEGWTETSLPFGLAARGARFFCQYVWPNSPSCGGSGPLSASNALEDSVQ